MAGLYILYYNLVAPYTPRGRRYIAAVNAYLERELRSERKPEPPARSFSPASPASQDDGER
jgi:hypothetical protein